MRIYSRNKDCSTRAMQQTHKLLCMQVDTLAKCSQANNVGEWTAVHILSATHVPSQALTGACLTFCSCKDALLWVSRCCRLAASHDPRLLSRRLRTAGGVFRPEQHKRARLSMHYDKGIMTLPRSLEMYNSHSCTIRLKIDGWMDGWMDGKVGG